MVDSSVWIANLRQIDSPEVRFLESIRKPRDVLVGDLVLLEVLQGARDELHAARIERRLRQFPVTPFLNEKLATLAAHHFRHLRSLGITIRRTNDLIIATFCIASGHSLLHSDRDFLPFVEHLGLESAL